MTKDKARKRDTRARMDTTGERYAAAQRHTQATKLVTEEYGQTDAAVRDGTGRGWNEWIRILDRWGATGRTHTEIARHVRGDLGVDGWWAQAVTVGYERARGMRAKHQRADGFYVSVSKTVDADVDRLAAMWTDPRKRNRWLPRGSLRVRTTHARGSNRFDFSADGSRLLVTYLPKGEGRSTVNVTHERLSDAAGVEEMRSFWRQRLGALEDLLRT